MARRPAPARGPYLTGAYCVEERIADFSAYPFSLPYVRGLDVALDRAVTFFVGENGSGKSTLLEALAEVCRFSSAGGGLDDTYDDPLAGSRLASALRPRFRQKPRDGFFFRAENLVNFATLLDKRRDDPDFLGDPYGRYGGQSLHNKSHGEAFLQVFESRVGEGLFLIDEPEAALSPQRQLSLLYLMHDCVKRFGTQLIVATHSPILLTYPGAVILNFDSPNLDSIRLADTNHFQITQGILSNPERYWKGLVEPEPDE
jgi:predicted ATPase